MWEIYPDVEGSKIPPDSARHTQSPFKLLVTALRVIDREGYNMPGDE